MTHACPFCGATDHLVNEFGGVAVMACPIAPTNKVIMVGNQRVICPLEPKVIERLELYKRDLYKRGGRPQVIVVNAGERKKHLNDASEVIGLRVVVRDWMPDDKLLILSEQDLIERDARYE